MLSLILLHLTNTAFPLRIFGIHQWPFLVVYDVLSHCGRYSFYLENIFYNPSYTVQFNKCKIMYFQVICKKFQIPCPVELALVINETMNSTLTQPAGFAVELNLNISEIESCKPRYFIFNSQVSKRNLCFLTGRF